jgi:hypothetical protein
MAFYKAISDNHNLYIFVQIPGNSNATTLPSGLQNPYRGLPAAANVWTDAEKDQFRDCLSRISAADKENALQLRTDTSVCVVREEQEYWMRLHPKAALRKQDTVKLQKCFQEYSAKMKNTTEEFHAVFDLCMCKAYGLPKPKL